MKEQRYITNAHMHELASDRRTAALNAERPELPGLTEAIEYPKCAMRGCTLKLVSGGYEVNGELYCWNCGRDYEVWLEEAVSGLNWKQDEVLNGDW
jgi:hypothetical protein